MPALFAIYPGVVVAVTPVEYWGLGVIWESGLLNFPRSGFTRRLVPVLAATGSPPLTILDTALRILHRVFTHASAVSS